MEGFFYIIGKVSFQLYKRRISKDGTSLPSRGVRSLKRVCVLTPKGDIGPHSGVAEQLFYTTLK